MGKTTPITESGFVRVSSNPSAVDGAVSPSEAIVMLGALRRYGSHRLIPDDVAIDSHAHVDLERLLSYKQTTDAHLIELAGRHRMRLVSFDRRLRSLVGGDGSKVVELLSPV